MDDEMAPFWKIKRKEWYQNLKGIPRPESRELDAYLSARERLRLMDEAMTQMGGLSPETQVDLEARAGEPVNEAAATVTVPA